MRDVYGSWDTVIEPISIRALNKLVKYEVI
jgi:hypothetical protein